MVKLDLRRLQSQIRDDNIKKMKWNAGKLMWLRFIVSLFLFYAQQFYVLNNLVTEIFSAVARIGLLEPNLGNVFQGKTLPLVMSFPKKIPAVISTRLSWTRWGNKVLPEAHKIQKKKTTYKYNS